MHRRRPRGFTIVELAIVVIVIGIVIAVSMISYMQIQAQSRNDQRSAQLTVFIKELEKFYQAKGQYPPGCPDASCPNVMHTMNTASSPLTPNTTLTGLRTIRPGIDQGFSDPQSPNRTLPLKNRTLAEKKYYYFGGTVNDTASVLTLDSPSHANFPCTLRSTLTAGQVGSYVVGYFEEMTNSWILKGGRDGAPITVASGTCVIVRA